MIIKFNFSEASGYIHFFPFFFNSDCKTVFQLYFSKGGFGGFIDLGPFFRRHTIYILDGRHSTLTFSIKTPQSQLQTRNSFKRLTCGPQQASTVAALMCFGSPVGLPSCPGSFQDEGHTLNYTSICRAWVRMCVGWREVGEEWRGGRSECEKKKRPKIVCVPEENGQLLSSSSFGILIYKKAAGVVSHLFFLSSVQMEIHSYSC